MISLVYDSFFRSVPSFIFYFPFFRLRINSPLLWGFLSFALDCYKQRASTELRPVPRWSFLSTCPSFCSSSFAVLTVCLSEANYRQLNPALAEGLNPELVEGLLVTRYRKRVKD